MHPYRCIISAPIRLHSLCLALSLVLSLIASRPRFAVAAERAIPQDAATLYTTTDLWTIHLNIAPDQFKEMEPKSGSAMGLFFGNRGRPRQLNDTETANLLAHAWLKEADDNRDNHLSRPEMQALSTRWFTEWDKSKSGQLKPDQVRAGIHAAVTTASTSSAGGSWLQGSEGKRNGLASAMGIEFQYVHGQLQFEEKTFPDIAIRYKGNGTFLESRGSLKRLLKLDLNAFDKTQKLAGITKLNLHNCVTDASWMNEVLSHQLFRDAGVPAPRTAYAKVYVTVPGKYDKQYFGLYSLVENIDAHLFEERFNSKNSVILKPVTSQLFADLGDHWNDYKQAYDPKSPISDEQTRRIIELSQLVSYADDDRFAATLDSYLDLDEFARFMAVTVYLSTLDSILAIGQNYYVYLDGKTNKFQFLPWDLDHSFGQFPMIGSQDQRENLSINKPWQGHNRFLDRVFKVPTFKKIYLGHLDEFSKTIFKPERIHQQVADIAKAIHPAVEEESAKKLKRFDRVAAGETADPPGFFSRPPKPIIPFVTIRTQSIIDQLAGTKKGLVLDQGGIGNPTDPEKTLADTFFAALDQNKDGTLSREEFTTGLDSWYVNWDNTNSGTLTESQLRAGITHDLIPPPAALPTAPTPPDKSAG